MLRILEGILVIIVILASLFHCTRLRDAAADLQAGMEQPGMEQPGQEWACEADSIWAAMGEDAERFAEGYLGGWIQPESVTYFQGWESVSTVTTYDPELIDALFTALDEMTVIEQTEEVWLDVCDVITFHMADGSECRVEFNDVNLWTEHDRYKVDGYEEVRNVLNMIENSAPFAGDSAPFADDADDQFVLGPGGEIINVNVDPLAGSDMISFGRGDAYSMYIPQGYVISDTDEEGLILGRNEETGGELAIRIFEDLDTSLEEIARDCEDTLENVEIWEGFYFPYLTAYDPDNDVDMCILTDPSGTTFYFVGFSRVDGENLGAVYFDTIAPDEAF